MTKRTTSNRLFLITLAATLGFASAGCDSDDDDAAKNDTTKAHIEVAGTWENTGFGEEDAIDDATWSQTFGPAMATDFVITSFDNATNTAILEDPDGKFNRWQWTDVDGDSFYYCTVDFGLDSAEDAENSDKTADDSDPETTGCGSFPWTKLTKQ
jgi:hypothetical protein